MRHRVKRVLLAAAIAGAGCLAAACVQSASGAVTASSPGVTAPATDTLPPSPTSAAPSPTPSVASPTEAPTTAAPTSPATSPASSSGLASDLIWLWIVLGVLVLLGIIYFATRGPSRSSVAAASWRSRAEDAYAAGAALDRAVRAAERQGASAEGTSARYDVQRYGDDLTQRLYAMRETAPNEERRGQVANALAALQDVRYAADAQRAPGAAGAQQSGPLHARLLDLESSLNELRLPDDPLR